MSTTTLRPNAIATDSASFVNTGGAASKTAAVSDDLDTTYLAVATGATMAFDLGTFAFAGATINSVTMRVRGLDDPGPEGGANDIINVYAKLSGTRSGQAATLAAVPVIQTNPSAAITSKPGGGAWDQAAIDILQAEVEFIAGDTPAGRVVEIYADVDYTAAVGQRFQTQV